MFIGAMSTQGVVTAPLSDRILHGGAVGYGWLNAGWGVGAFLSAAYVHWLSEKIGLRRTMAVSMAILSACLFLLPFSGLLAIAVSIYLIMGSGRGAGGIAMN